RYKKNQASPKPAKPLVKGINYLLNEEPDKALAFFIQHRDIDQYTAETFLLLGNSFRNRGEVDRALKVHQNLIARPNLSAQQKQAAMLALGEDFFAAGLFDRAEHVFQELLQRNAQHRQACQFLREIYEHLKEWEKAIEVVQCEMKIAQPSAQSASQSTPNQKPELTKNHLMAHYYCEIAMLELKKGNVYHVDLALKKALKADKHSLRVKVITGDVALYEEKYTKARKIYFEVIKEDSRLLGILFDKLLTLARQHHSYERFYDFLLTHYHATHDNTVLEHLLLVVNQPDYPLPFKQVIAIQKVIEKELSDNRLSVAAILQSVNVLLHLQNQIQKTTTATTESQVNDSLNDDSLNSEITHLKLLQTALQNHLKGQLPFQCVHCGYQMNEYLWRCPVCRHWDTISQVK
ncbi:MAG TPA: tetratricopeptide repeat protein, partial [Thiothrix sp.]|nr:tetratricopeptide repeat protein [Thiothrix sp.]